MMHPARNVFEKVKQACLRVGRDPSSITIVAASKKQSVDSMRVYLALCRELGIRSVIGENYVQEFQDKVGALKEFSFESHLIGPLQSNKISNALKLFDLIESVHSIELASKLNGAAQKEGRTVPIYLQINISNDPAKHGILPENVDSTVEAVLLFRGVELKGLMTITQLYENPEDARLDFRAMKKIADRLKETFDLSSPLELSMGMSDDYVVAIEEGATVIRVGTAIFGERA